MLRGIECTVSWAAAEDGQAIVTLICNRDVDAPKVQRVALLVAGVIGSFLFMNQYQYNRIVFANGRKNTDGYPSICFLEDRLTARDF